MRAQTVATLAAMMVIGGFAGDALSQSNVPYSAQIGPASGVPKAASVAAAQTNSTSEGDALSQPKMPLLHEGPPVAYTDPKRGFMLVAPPGSRFQHRGEDQPIAIQSRKGFAVNIQAGDANPGITMQHMFAKLEAQYLGEGKPWSAKLSDGEAVIAGLPAGYSVYEAGSTRTRVIIARGQKTDFVFMFFAPINQFEKLGREFDWILTSFRPAADELPSEPVHLSRLEPKKPDPAPLRAQQDAVANPSGRPAPSVAARPANTHVFAEPGYGYQVEYPAEWQLEKVSAFTNVISGPVGSPAYDAIVAMQNVQPNGVADAHEAAEIAFTDLKASLSRDATEVDFVGEKVVAYAKYGLNLEGRQFVASYEHQGRRFRKWALVLPRPDGTVAHIWSYTAPIDRFEDFRPVAEQILHSLKIDGGQG